MSRIHPTRMLTLVLLSSLALACSVESKLGKKSSAAKDSGTPQSANSTAAQPPAPTSGESTINLGADPGAKDTTDDDKTPANSATSTDTGTGTDTGTDASVAAGLIDPCTLIGPAPMFCVANGNFSCTYSGVTPSLVHKNGCNSIIALQGLYADACKAKTRLDLTKISCTDPLGGGLPIGGALCGAFPTNVGLTAEQTLCCENGKWTKELGKSFGGPGCPL